MDDRRSTSGYFTFICGNLVTWKNKKQNVVARSSVEAEFRGMALGLCEALWLKLLLQDLGYISRHQSDCFVTIKPHVILLIIQYNMIVQSMSRWTDSSLRRNWMIRLWNCLRFDQKINWPISSPKLQS